MPYEFTIFSNRMAHARLQCAIVILDHNFGPTNGVIHTNAIHGPRRGFGSSLPEWSEEEDKLRICDGMDDYFQTRIILASHAFLKNV